MFGFLRAVLSRWSALCVFFAIVLIAGILYSLYRSVSCGDKIDWTQFDLPVKSRSLKAILIVLFIVGIVNAVLSLFFTKNEIGAFYEADEYFADYEATVSVNSCAVPCVATISKYGDDYYIYEIQLPYGRSQYAGDAEYDARSNYARVDIGYDLQWEGSLSLAHPATSESYSRLTNYSRPSSSEFCASVDSDVYHLKDCYYVQNIVHNNLIYFDSDLEAEILGFEVCSVCHDHL